MNLYKIFNITIFCILLSCTNAEQLNGDTNLTINLVKNTERIIDINPSITQNAELNINGKKIKVTFANRNMKISVAEAEYLSLEDGVIFRYSIVGSSIYFVVNTTVEKNNFSGMYFENFYSITFDSVNGVKFKKHLDCVIKRQLWKCNDKYLLAGIDEIVGFSDDGKFVFCKASLIQKALIKPGEPYEYWEIALKVK